MPRADRRPVTYAEIMAARDAPGGWTAGTMAKLWGVPWPPPAFWKERLVKDGAPYRRSPSGSDDYRQSPYQERK